MDMVYLYWGGYYGYGDRDNGEAVGGIWRGVRKIRFKNLIL